MRKGPKHTLTHIGCPELCRTHPRTSRSERQLEARARHFEKDAKGGRVDGRHRRRGDDDRRGRRWQSRSDPLARRGGGGGPLPARLNGQADAADCGVDDFRHRSGRGRALVLGEPGPHGRGGRGGAEEAAARPSASPWRAASSSTDATGAYDDDNDDDEEKKKEKTGPHPCSKNPPRRAASGGGAPSSPAAGSPRKTGHTPPRRP
jgi:hypothetical protein